MATLNSPGVSVTISDESQYLPAATNSIPFVLLATAQNKLNPSGTAIAAGTTSANANKLFRVTSQRDLVNLYGNPFFYTSSDGTPLQGNELNEYGLLTAYDALGVSNTIYCMRADIDLGGLVSRTSRPTGNPQQGQLWLDTAQSAWGVYQFNSVTGQFALQSPIVITDDAQLNGGAPLQTIGQIGQYAVVVTASGLPSDPDGRQLFVKTESNQWVEVGSSEWLDTIPTVQGTVTDPALTAGHTFAIGLSSSTTVKATITVPASPNNNIAGVASAINDLGWQELKAAVLNGRLYIYSSQSVDSDISPKYVHLQAGTGTVLDDIGVLGGNHYQPSLFFGRSWQQPLWQSSQAVPRPSGSVWVKVGASGNGLNPVMAIWNNSTASWSSVPTTLATNDWEALSVLDATGGKNIPVGTIYAQYAAVNNHNPSSVYYWQKNMAGPAHYEGMVSNPVFSTGPYTLRVATSVPGSNLTSAWSVVNLPNNSTAADLVNALTMTGNQYLSASVNQNGNIVLTHNEGGVILLDGADTLLVEAGLSAHPNAKYGHISTVSYNVPTTTDSVDGENAELLVTSPDGNGRYYIAAILDAGAGYLVGDKLTVSGALLGGTSPANDLVAVVTSVGASGVVTGVAVSSGTAVTRYATTLSPWVKADVVAQRTVPTGAPANGTTWFYAVPDQVDVMVNVNGEWKGYRNQSYDSNGFPVPVGGSTTDPNGPLVRATAPESQSNGAPLVYGDLWIDTSDLENYPVINRWQSVDGEDRWVRIDNTNQVDPSGVVFADARWADGDTTNPAADDVPSIVSLLTSNYVDLDAPNASLYPTGMILFNTRRSGYNVKQYRRNYFNPSAFPGLVLPLQTDAWVSVSGLKSDGSPYMGRKAQRAMIVKALKAAIDTNSAIRDEDNFFTLITAPGYPELQPNMVALNTDRGETAFIIGDTPMRLPEDATAIQNWATNAAGAASTGDEGLVTRSNYMGLYYPSGLSSDLSGNAVVVPASHMVLRTFLRSDAMAYPWLAAAGTRRGVIDNASSIGYIDSRTGEYVATKTSRVGIRDVLYMNQINPLVFFTGNGLMNYGNKSSLDSQSAMDRVNVARLAAYIKRQADIAARPFIFEQNDPLTRQQLAGVLETLMIDLVAKRGITDYLIVCDSSNNTPERIDRNEMWADIAVIPTNSTEYIYIPVRLLNTGELSG